jgi:hypothetical protein
MLERVANSRIGMIGYFANFASMTKNNAKVAIPATSRPMTMPLFQGCSVPPYSRPRRNMTVAPVSRAAPAQSIAFRPALRFVVGVLTSRKITVIANASPSSGRLM